MVDPDFGPDYDILDLQDQHLDTIGGPMSRRTRLTLAGAGSGMVTGGALSYAWLGADAASIPGGAFALLIVSLFTGVGGLVPWGKVGESEQAAAQPAPEPPDEPVDRCAHVGRDGFEAVPVEVRTDEDGDSEPDIVAWLCSQCGAKVSPPGAPAKKVECPEGHPDRVSALRESLASKHDEIKRLTEQWKTDPVHVTVQQHREFTRAIEDAEEFKRLIDREEEVGHIEGTPVLAYGSTVPVRTIEEPGMAGAPRHPRVGQVWVDYSRGGIRRRWDGQRWRAQSYTDTR